MIGFCPLASGSKGNSFFLGTADCKILIDLGISKNSVLPKLSELGVHPEDIHAILVTHEHIDHTSGIKSFAKTFGTPIIANLETAKALCRSLEFHPQFKIFSTGDTFKFQDLTIRSFSVCHDAVDPVGFVFSYQNERLGFCTDTGFVTSLLITDLMDCDYLVVEANHEPDLVLRSSRPSVYKNRVLSRLGHLSNDECGKLLSHITSPKLKELYLAHLSAETNTEQIAFDKVCFYLSKTTKVIPKIAYQDKLSEPLFFEKSTKLISAL
ncbi:MBL fold metallo-hydrolase [Chlamydiifrater phoenicopteri]|uniref:MBL fold metallo-hydrolase n=1 Tax=Chlamydiifrater phoenicopteri TaxID=2681469 RepID=UPI001BCED9DA|nr:MBL fold metallo-hydrolase [Chlamydiifrater phoenicopteri]